MHEVLHAKDLINNEPFIVCFSDILYKCETPATKQLIQEYKRTGKNIRSNARFLFKPSSFKIIEKEKFNLGEDLADLDVFDKLRQDNDLQEFTIEGNMYNIGDPLSYLETETIFALEDKEIGEEYKQFLKKQFNE
jgi:UTP--glucose-1-phosphate uridylyltransferase